MSGSNQRLVVPAFLFNHRFLRYGYTRAEIDEKHNRILLLLKAVWLALNAALYRSVMSKLREKAYE